VVIGWEAIVPWATGRSVRTVLTGVRIVVANVFVTDSVLLSAEALEHVIAVAI